MSSKDNKKSLEECFEELETVIEALEDSDITLADSFKEYEKGMELVKLCHEKIGGIEKEVLLLNDEGDTEKFD